MTNIQIPPNNDCLTYQTYGNKTHTDDFICGLNFTVTTECVSSSGSGDGNNGSGSGGISGDYIIVTVNITQQDFPISYIIIQVEICDKFGAIIKPFENDATMTGNSISFNVPRPVCPANPTISLEIGSISVRLGIPCEENIGTCGSGSGSGSEYRGSNGSGIYSL